MARRRRSLTSIYVLTAAMSLGYGSVIALLAEIRDRFDFSDTQVGLIAFTGFTMGFVAQAVTDWAGAGRVRRIGVRFTGLVRLKDTVTCRGRVVRTSPQNGLGLVDLEIWAENQRGEKVVSGTATVALPSRES